MAIHGARRIGLRSLLNAARVFMEDYSLYVTQLEDLLRANDASPARMAAALSTEPVRQLRRLVSRETLRAAGAFFTPARLATQLVRDLDLQSAEWELALDPTCGAGNLLIAVARCLPICKTFEETLRLWGQKLAGLDSETAFVRATKVRLAMLAAIRHRERGAAGLGDINGLFPLIRCGDALQERSLYREADVVLLNPPYSHMLLPEEIEWSKGRTTAAALFVDRCVSRIRDGARVGAILPEVLRCGSRFSSWRTHIQKSVTIERVRAHGVFDQTADIDVFTLLLRKCAPRGVDPASWWNNITAMPGRLGSLFDVSVGASCSTPQRGWY
jgi:hypothetical protein